MVNPNTEEGLLMSIGELATEHPDNIGLAALDADYFASLSEELKPALLRCMNSGVTVRESERASATTPPPTQTIDACACPRTFSSSSLPTLYVQAPLRFILIVVARACVCVWLCSAPHCTADWPPPPAEPGLQNGLLRLPPRGLRPLCALLLKRPR